MSRSGDAVPEDDAPWSERRKHFSKLAIEKIVKGVERIVRIDYWDDDAERHDLIFKYLGASSHLEELRGLSREEQNDWFRAYSLMAEEHYSRYSESDSLDVWGPRISFTEFARDEEERERWLARLREERARFQRDSERHVFRPDGDEYILQFRGPAVRIKPTRGFQYIHYLLGHPDESVPAVLLEQVFSEGELKRKHTAASVDAELRTLAGESSYPLADEETLRQVEQALAEREEEAKEPETPERGCELRDEIDSLKRYLKRVKTPSGRARFTETKKDSARKRTQVLISYAIDKKIAPRLPNLAAHLSRHLKTGEKLIYIPGSEQPDWIL